MSVPPKNPPCPICSVTMPGPWMEYPQYPFCSKRCKLIDLGRWLGEGYAIETDQKEEEKTDRE